MPKIEPVAPVSASTAKNAIEPDTNSLLTFTLPDVTETAQDFIQDDAPEKSESELSQEAPKVEYDAEAEKHRGTPDSKGNAYDPMIHAYPPEMTGKLRKWKKKPKAQIDKAIVDEVKSNTTYRAEADKFASLYAQAHMLIFGRDGRLINKEDVAPLTDDLERYMQENGHTNISAGWAVALSAGLYSMGVCQREPNAKKIKRVFGNLWDKTKSLFSRNKKENGFKRASGDNLDKHRTPAETSKQQRVEPIVNDNISTDSYEQYKNGF